MKVKKSLQLCGSARQLGAKKCSPNPPPTKTLLLDLPLYVKALSAKNASGNVQTQIAVVVLRLPKKKPNKAAIVKLKNHSRASIPCAECARPNCDQVDHIGDSTAVVPRIAMARFNANAPKNLSELLIAAFFGALVFSGSDDFVTAMFRRCSSLARTVRASSRRESGSVASVISSSSVLAE